MHKKREGSIEYWITNIIDQSKCHCSSILHTTYSILYEIAGGIYSRWYLPVFPRGVLYYNPTVWYKWYSVHLPFQTDIPTKKRHKDHGWGCFFQSYGELKKKKEISPTSQMGWRKCSKSLGQRHIRLRKSPQWVHAHD